MRVHKEGIPFVLLGLAFSLATIFLFPSWGMGLLILPLYIAYFFRDPERKTPQDPSAVVSPADGRVICVTATDEARFLKKKMLKISIFMSVFNVHINRVPMSGRIQGVFYRPGKFLIGFAEKASLDNEQNAIMLETQGGREILFIQIAGFIARRIVCYLKGEEQVTAGERFGLIRFGSRMDVYLPLNAKAAVHEGEKVRGGESILARFSL